MVSLAIAVWQPALATEPDDAIDEPPCLANETGIVHDGLVNPSLYDALGRIIGDGPFGPEDVDLYAFEVTPEGLPAQVIVLAAGYDPPPIGLDPFIRLFDLTGVELAVGEELGTNHAELNSPILAPGTYYVGISSWTDDGMGGVVWPFYDAAICGGPGGPNYSLGNYDLYIEVLTTCLDDADCDDLDPCNGDESCEGGECVPGEPLANVPPVANAGGPYVIEAGEPLQMDGSGSFEPNAPCDEIIWFDWDINGDDVWGDESGPTPNIPWFDLDNLLLPGSYPADPETGEPNVTVGLRVTDTHGATHTHETTLTIYEILPPTSELYEPYTDSEDCSSTGSCPPSRDGRGGAYNVRLFSGEFHEEVTDLRIPGRGLDFSWQRTYRSRTGRETAMGYNWDFNYNLYLTPAGADFAFHDGTGRVDLFQLQPDGTWARREYFREITEQPGISYTMITADKTVFTFHSFDGLPHMGKVASIADRNGNTITFVYDPATGRLDEINDTLGRTITLTYNGDRIETITDFAGRTVSYDYQDGDLMSVTTPVVIGTPNGNDFPSGKTTVYGYATGLAEPDLNHNLLTITDPAGKTVLTNVYHPLPDPTDPNFDRVTRQVWGDPGDNIDLVYLPVEPLPENYLSVIKAIVNDRVGNVEENFFDSQNRLVMVREFTGRADPDNPTDDTTNRPVGQLRPGDPPYFETSYAYNEDSLLTLVNYPNGNSITRVYERELDSLANPRLRGNLRETHQWPGPLGGEQPSIDNFFVYHEGFGNCSGTAFVTHHTDGRGNLTFCEYDAFGNHHHTQHRVPSCTEDWERNEFGQVTAYITPDNGNGHRRRDEFEYYTSGPQMGYLKQVTVDATVRALTTQYEYDVVGNVTRVINPRLRDTQYIFNALNQIVRILSAEADESGVRYTMDTFYDANDNVVRIDVDNRDETGAPRPNPFYTTVHEYGTLNQLVRTCRESGDYTGAIPGGPTSPTCDGLPEPQFVTYEYDHDANRNRTLLRNGEATNGNQPTNILSKVYDERDLLFLEIQAEGDPLQSTTQFDYDGNGNLALVTEGLEDIEPHLTQFGLDGYNRRISMIDAMGNATTYRYDANGNREYELVEGELIDVPGSAGNIRLYENTYSYDPLNREIRKDMSYFDPETQTPLPGGRALGLSITDIEYNENSQVIRIIDDNLHETNISYDTVSRPALITDARGNTRSYEYDENSNVILLEEVENSDTPGEPDEIWYTNYTYDGLDRRIRTEDIAGHQETFGYDSRDNLVLAIDYHGNSNLYTYDGLARRLEYIRIMTNDGSGDGTPVGQITTHQSWDDSSRLKTRIDGSVYANVTTYSYDPLNRLIGTLYADATGESYEHDAHGNRKQKTDGNGTTIDYSYDPLNRRISENENMQQATTFAYDGMSRPVEITNDDAVVTRGYDSLANVTRETINGVVTSASYDGVGNQLSLTYPGGRTITTSHDPLNRPLTISDSVAGILASYRYVGPDRVRRRDHLGNGTWMVLAYDGLNNIPEDEGVRQVVQSTHYAPDATPLDSRTYRWNPVNQKIRRQDVLTGGLTHDYLYDSMYRLTGALVTDESLGVIRDTTYQLDDAGNRMTVSGGICSGSYHCDATMPEPADCQSNQYTGTAFQGRAYDQNGNLIVMGTEAGLSPSPPPPPFDARKNRYLSFEPNHGGLETAFQVRITFSAYFPESFGIVGWVGEPDADGIARIAAEPYAATNWPSVVHVGDCQIVPVASYEIRAVRDGALFSTSLNLETIDQPGSSKWADVVGTFTGGEWTPPNGVVNFEDILATVKRFQLAPGAPHLTWVDVDGEIPNTVVNFADVMRVVQGFQVADYPFNAPSACPGGPPLCPSRNALLGYDFKNRLVEYVDTLTNQRHTYEYDGLGRRIAKTVDADGSSSRTNYNYDGWRIIEERDPDAGSTLATYVYGQYIDEVLQMRRDVTGGGQFEDFYYHADDMHSVMVVTDSAGLVVERYEYDDYGQPEFRNADGSPIADSAIGNPYLFTGRRFDAETGLYHYRTRYLDPLSGRFTTRDQYGIDVHDNFHTGAGSSVLTGEYAGLFEQPTTSAVRRVVGQEHRGGVARGGTFIMTYDSSSGAGSYSPGGRVPAFSGLGGIWGDAINLGNGYTFVGNNPQSLLDPHGLYWVKPWGMKSKMRWIGKKPATRGYVVVWRPGPFGGWTIPDIVYVPPKGGVPLVPVPLPSGPLPASPSGVGATGKVPDGDTPASGQTPGTPNPGPTGGPTGPGGGEPVHPPRPQPTPTDWNHPKYRDARDYFIDPNYPPRRK
jgi:RHS repeat-associated protein